MPESGALGSLKCSRRSPTPALAVERGGSIWTEWKPGWRRETTPCLSGGKASPLEGTAREMRARVWTRRVGQDPQESPLDTEGQAQPRGSPAD